MLHECLLGIHTHTASLQARLGNGSKEQLLIATRHGDRNPLGPSSVSHLATQNNNVSGQPVSVLHNPSSEKDFLISKLNFPQHHL